MPKTPIITNYFQICLIRILIKISFITNAFLAYKSFSKAWQVLSEIKLTLQKVWGQPELLKFSRVNGRFYWNFTGPHWPSTIQKKYLWDELNRVVPFREERQGLRVLYYAITSACPLDCDHCLEWDRLNGNTDNDVNNMISQIKQFQKTGVAQIQLSGGEPLARFNDLIQITSSVSDQSDVWVLTSGFGITNEKIRRMKKAGITGIAFSIDHFDADVHDRYRGKKGVFKQAITGAQMAHDAGIVVCFALCARKEFISYPNLLNYAKLASITGASFINIIEPKAVGRYADADVAIPRSQQEILEQFYYAINFDKEFREFPIVAYPNYQMRKIGCMGHGQRVVYVNSRGELNACPFCHENEDRLNEGNIDELLNVLRTKKCKNFEPMKM